MTAELDRLMRRGWLDGGAVRQQALGGDREAARRRRVSEQFPGELIAIPAGNVARRANDTDYRFRADSAHVYLSASQAAGATLVLDDGDASLYLAPGHARDAPGYWHGERFVESWRDRRPSLAETEERLGLRCTDVAELPAVLAGSVARVMRGIDPVVDALVCPRTNEDEELAALVSHLRLVKDEWEIGQLRDAIETTVLGFEDAVRDWSNALAFGERWIEGTFWRRARSRGNDVGYSSIVAAGAHSTILDWTENDGQLAPGGLVLMDMGAEARSLYTADVTRVLPATRTFAGPQREVYDVVLAAQDAAIAVVRAGVPYAEIARASDRVLADGLAQLGVLPCSADVALESTSQVFRRWTMHGTGHMLGLDVHDCSRGQIEDYSGGILETGMVLTIEPGLYFQPDDAIAPPELRGIGIRIEDDFVVEGDGCDNLSAALPRTAKAVEEWMADLA